MFPIWIMSGIWGLFAGSALILGAVAGYFFKIPQRIIAAIMAFGAGVLMSAVSFELLNEAYTVGGVYNVILGFLLGATIFTTANVYLARSGAKHRKRSGKKMLSGNGSESSGPAIAVGSIIDGIPESIAIGLTMIEGGVVSTATVIAIFLSNIPEGLSSSAGLKTMGWNATRVFLLWIGVTICTGFSSLAGYTIFGQFDPAVISIVLSLSAGGILAMLVDTMIPEAFSETHNLAGMITVSGFIISFILSKLG